MRQPNRLTMVDRYKLSKILEEVLDINVTDHTASYKDGHNDATVAKAFGGVDIKTVSRTRLALFGMFPESVPKVSKREELEQLQRDVNLLRARISYIESQLGIDFSKETNPDMAEVLRAMGE